MPEKTKKIWMNGKFVDWDEAKVHVLVHGLHYGSGVFEGIRCYKTVKGPAVFRLREHVKRFFSSAKIYFMEIPYSLDEFMEIIKETVRVNELEECYIRPLAFKGLGGMSLDPSSNPTEVIVAVWPWGAYLGEEAFEKGATCTISSWVRISNAMLPMEAKASGQYLNSILASMEAHRRGFTEAIMLDSRGLVSEGTGENIFVVANEVIYTPPLEASILHGVTRDSVIEIAENLGFNVVEKNLTRSELFTADEVFFTGTAAEITPIVEIDHRKVGNGKVGEVTKKLRNEFLRVIREADEKYRKWLAFV